jgi:adenylate kinase
MVKDRLNSDDAKGGFILDGFPRSAVQLAAVEYLNPIERVVLLELDDATAIARLGGRSECTACGILYGANRPPKTPGKCDECGKPLKERSDDKDTTAIKSRLAAYHAEIKAMVDYYEWKGALRRVDAAGTVEQVLQSVLVALEK